jgi:hypothetical protein
MTAKPYGIWLERTTPSGEPVNSWATITRVGPLARYATAAEAEAAAGRFRALGHNATAKPFGEMAEDE